MIHVVVTGGATLCREALAAALRAHPDFSVATIASPQAVPRPLPADAVVVQLCLPRAEAKDSRRAGCEPAAGARSLLICCSLPREKALALLQKGIGGIFPIGYPLAELPAAIRAVAGGGSWLDPEHVKLLVDAVSGKRDSVSLTARERAVLELVADGLTNKEIGRRLGLSEASVKATLQRLFRKSGVRTRSQLVRESLQILDDGL